MRRRLGAATREARIRDNEFLAAVEALGVPAYVIDPEGTITWLNAAARNLVGDATGRRFTDVVAPEDVRHVQEEFTKKLLGADATDFDANLLDTRGRRVTAELSSVPLRRDHRVVCVFGVVAHLEEPIRQPPTATHPLTPRQHEVLRLLGNGASTRDIARQLGVSTHTVRNHVRGVLRALGADSRLEAVVVARERGLV